MTMSVLAAFAATCVLLAVTPGPNMSLIIANTLSGGLRAGLATLAGTLTGLTILVSIAAVGMTSVMVFMSEWFELIRWVGALYLIFLGVQQLRTWRRAGDAARPDVPAVSTGSRYGQGLLIALSNPKVLLFLGAFFPHFVDQKADPGPQLAVLALVFVAILALVDLAYTLAIAKARDGIAMQRLRVLDGLAGGLLVVGGVILATTRRP
jgi:threonine/homoserine/homoserine lactone efflux protein